MELVHDNIYIDLCDIRVKISSQSSSYLNFGSDNFFKRTAFSCSSVYKLLGNLKITF